VNPNPTSQRLGPPQGSTPRLLVGWLAGLLTSSSAAGAPADERGILGPRARPLEPDTRSISLREGLVLGASTGLRPGYDVSVALGLPLDQAWPLFFLATGRAELNGGEWGVLSARAGVGALHLRGSNRSVGLGGLGVLATVRHPNWKGDRLHLTLGLSAWGGVGEQLNAVIEPANQLLGLAECSIDWRIGQHSSLLLDTATPLIWPEANADPTPTSMVATAWRTTGKRWALDLGFLRTTGTLAAFNPLGLGFPYAAITFQP